MDFGGDTRTERLYRAHRSTVGQGGSAANEDRSIEALWRLCRMRAFARVAAMAERSALQAFPDHSTDLLPYYERLLMLTPSPADTLEERQAAAAERYALQIQSAVRTVADGLQRLDPRFEIIATDADRSTTTVAGRAFEDLAHAEPFVGSDDEDSPWSGRQSTAWPNYSSEFVADVVLELGDGVQPSALERLTIAAARRFLHDVLPAHNDVRVSTHRGFTLDVSRLDLTSLGGEA